MLFEDDMEIFDDGPKPSLCVAVPLKAHFSLKDLWVPAELLINCKRVIDSTRNRPNIFHTLNHPPDTETFSVYFEDFKGSADSKDSTISSNGMTDSEQELANFLAILKKVPKDDQECQTATMNTEKQDEKNSEQPEPVLDTLDNESPVTIEDNTEKQDEKNSEQPEPVLDTLDSESPVTIEDNTENSENLLVSVNTEKQNEVENSVFEELPIAYQKHFLPDPPTKQKSQKEKKKKNAIKNMQLGDFLQTVNSDGYEIPQRDEFYESLVLQGKCLPIDFPSSTNYPEREFYVSPEWFNVPTDIPNESSSSLSKAACAGTVIEVNENVQSNGIEELEEGTHTTLILENVSCNISQENIESLMSGYGELKNVSLETNGKSLKVYVRLILQHDVEWIIDCLNGSEPFGASSCGMLKCYQEI